MWTGINSSQIVCVSVCLNVFAMAGCAKVSLRSLNTHKMFVSWLSVELDFSCQIQTLCLCASLSCVLFRHHCRNMHYSTCQHTVVCSCTHARTHACTHARTHAHIHTHNTTPSLLLCEKPQLHNEPQICPVNWCSHKHTRRHKYTHIQMP